MFRQDPFHWQFKGLTGRDDLGQAGTQKSRIVNDFTTFNSNWPPIVEMSSQVCAFPVT